MDGSTTPHSESELILWTFFNFWDPPLLSPFSKSGHGNRESRHFVRSVEKSPGHSYFWLCRQSLQNILASRPDLINEVSREDDEMTTFAIDDAGLCLIADIYDLSKKEDK